MPGKAGDCGVTADNRLFVEAVLWMARTGAPWRDLPESFGHWNSVFKRFRRWVSKGVFERLFEIMAGQPDFEYALIDGHIFVYAIENMIMCLPDITRCPDSSG